MHFVFDIILSFLYHVFTAIVFFLLSSHISDAWGLGASGYMW